MEQEQVLRVENICKNFSSTKALSDVTLEVYRGQIKGLVGENGSGKSTLTSIISGNLKQDSGTMYLFGKPYQPSDSFEASSKGIVMIVQEQGTVGSITVAANLFAGREQMFCKGGILNRKKLNAAAQKLLEKVGATHIDVHQVTDKLSIEDRKLVEMARALYITPELFIVDETTTALSQRGREILYRIIDELHKQNKAVLFITHDISELLQICNTVTVLRDGVYVDTLSKEQMEENKIKSLMVGREVAEDIFHKNEYPPYESEDVVLDIDNVSYGLVKDVSVKLKKGEVLGIGGLSDCGMHDLAKIAYGLIKPERGKVTVISTKDVVKSPSVAIRNKIGFVAKNRDTEALLASASIKDNIVLPSLDMLKKVFFITRNSEKKLAVKWSKALEIKMRNVNQTCSELSGGNKQKVVLAKWMGNESNIFIMDCPTRGIDVGVKETVYRMINKLRSEGKSIIMISEELQEVLGMSDRIIIMKNGEVTKTFENTTGLTESEVIHYMI